MGGSNAPHAACPGKAETENFVDASGLGDEGSGEPTGGGIPGKQLRARDHAAAPAGGAVSIHSPDVPYVASSGHVCAATGMRALRKLAICATHGAAAGNRHTERSRCQLGTSGSSPPQRESAARAARWNARSSDVLFCLEPVPYRNPPTL